MDFYALALMFLTISTTGGAANFIITILSRPCLNRAIFEAAEESDLSVEFYIG
jgi:hypothetical protein